jgi:hypothetical protein
MTKTIKLTSRQIDAIRDFIRTERSGTLDDTEKARLALIFDFAKEVTIAKS